jgi:hypothetical protein
MELLRGCDDVDATRNRAATFRQLGRGTREAITTMVKVVGMSTSTIKAEELDGPLAGRVRA